MVLVVMGNCFVCKGALDQPACGESQISFLVVPLPCSSDLLINPLVHSLSLELESFVRFALTFLEQVWVMS